MASPTLVIYVSSPGDVLDERSALLEVVRRLQYDPFIGRIADLRVSSWDNPAAPLPLLASENPQISVNAMQPRPSACDLFVGVLWSRLGTPLPEQAFPRPGEGRYRSGTEWEIEDALAGGDRSTRPDVVIYRKTAPATVALGDTDWQERADQYQALQEYLAALQSNLQRHGLGTIQVFETLDQFRTMVDAHLRHLIARRLASRSPESRSRYRVPRWDPSRSPYPGLIAFTPADAEVFFGRDREVDALVDLVRTAPLTAVVGSSGSGKSSVIGAGLVPRLASTLTHAPPQWLTPTFDRDRSTWIGPRITPSGSGGDPLWSLALALGSVVKPETGTVQTDEPDAAVCRRLCAEAL